MGNLILRLLVNGLALWVASLLVNAVAAGGMTLTTEMPGLLIVVLIFGVVNALIKPVVSLFSCPITILTLGLFTLVINALMLMLTSYLAGMAGGAEWLRFSSFWTALFAGLIVSIVSTVLSFLVSDEG
jgi:putative membrane protein